MLNMGCGGGYFGSQMHWNTTSMNLDWAVWDIAMPKGPFSPPPSDFRFPVSGFLADSRLLLESIFAARHARCQSSSQVRHAF